MTAVSNVSANVTNRGLASAAARMMGPANQFGIREGSKSYARDTRAALVRSDFEDWKRRFLPMEKELLASYQNPQQRADLVRQNVGLVNRSFDSAGQNHQRYLTGLGVTPTAEQNQSIVRSQQLGRGLAEIEAINRTNRRLDDRDLAIALGGQIGNRSVELARGAT
jgi:hypothetical protein